ncbi:unnamed protein product [Didymodactylos carnosus]|uniref:Uncharacterized protein n=1 Tax=Didymodactylos carnosus TaxID=1234261 RepID=A0A813XMQ1_9BILA|nr:unnamed protein product [Didymodactylos carnosus]CAF3654709.1 unnamed protein product [Didymodactylos carnosus]
MSVHEASEPCWIKATGQVYDNLTNFLCQFQNMIISIINTQRYNPNFHFNNFLIISERISQLQHALNCDPYSIDMNYVSQFLSELSMFTYELGERQNESINNDLHVQQVNLFLKLTNKFEDAMKIMYSQQIMQQQGRTVCDNDGSLYFSSFGAPVCCMPYYEYCVTASSAKNKENRHKNDYDNSQHSTEDLHRFIPMKILSREGSESSIERSTINLSRMSTLKNGAGKFNHKTLGSTSETTPQSLKALNDTPSFRTATTVTPNQRAFGKKSDLLPKNWTSTQSDHFADALDSRISLSSTVQPSTSQQSKMLSDKDRASNIVFSINGSEESLDELNLIALPDPESELPSFSSHPSERSPVDSISEGSTRISDFRRPERKGQSNVKSESFGVNRDISINNIISGYHNAFKGRNTIDGKQSDTSGKASQVRKKESLPGRPLTSTSALNDSKNGRSRRTTNENSMIVSEKSTPVTSKQSKTGFIQDSTLTPSLSNAYTSRVNSARFSERELSLPQYAHHSQKHNREEQQQAQNIRNELLFALGTKQKMNETTLVPDISDISLLSVESPQDKKKQKSKSSSYSSFVSHYYPVTSENIQTTKISICNEKEEQDNQNRNQHKSIQPSTLLQNFAEHDATKAQNQQQTKLYMKMNHVETSMGLDAEVVKKIAVTSKKRNNDIDPKDTLFKYSKIYSAEKLQRLSNSNESLPSSNYLSKLTRCFRRFRNSSLIK